MKGSCSACRYTGILDRAHIKTKATGGAWDESNIIPLCRQCHTTSHRLGWFKFSLKHPLISEVLHEKGWEFFDRFGVIKLRRQE